MSASPNPYASRPNPHVGIDDPHCDAEVLSAGARLDDASAAVILLHGRYLGADSILPLADELDPGDVAFLAPEAMGHTWYPGSFLAAREENEPSLGSAMRALDRLVAEIASVGIPEERIALVGFSQGACLALEFVATRPRRWGGVASLIGGLFGPMGSRLSYPGALDATPIYLCTSEPDRLVPPERVRESADVLGRMGARVELLVERDAGHAISDAGLGGAKALIERIVPSHQPALRRA